MISVMPDADALRPILRYPVRRDGWDTIDYYLLFLIGAQVAGLGMLAIGISGQYSTPPKPLVLSCFWIIYGTLQFAYGIIVAGLQTWQRFAEAYELTDSEFIHHMGYCRKHAPFAEISRVHPIKICRSTAALKPAARIKFRKPDASEGGVVEFDIPGYKGSRPIRQAWSIDVSPVNLEGFLEELAERCPHLVREGPRFFPKVAKASND